MRSEFGDDAKTGSQNRNSKDHNRPATEMFAAFDVKSVIDNGTGPID
jgi:hypothetical protein